MVRYSAEHKEAQRARLLRDGGRLIKERGLRGLSLRTLASELGVSVSGLYTYFENSDAMAEALLEAEVQRSVDNFKRVRAAMDDGETRGVVWHGFLQSYLSLAHVRNPGAGCAIAALASDMPMQSPALRDTYTQASRTIATLIDESLGTQDRGHGILASVIGAINLARAEIDDDRAEAVLDSATGQILPMLLAPE